MKLIFTREVEWRCYRLCWKRVNIFLKFSRNINLNHESTRIVKPANYANRRALIRHLKSSKRLLCNRRCWKPLVTPIKRIFSDATDGSYSSLVTMLLLFRIGVTKRGGPRITRLGAGLRRGKPRIDAN